MGYLPFYATNSDIDLLLEYLNGSEDLAFLESTGHNRWKAVKDIPNLAHRSYCLWHVPSGPLPLLRDFPDRDRVISDPFKGWIEQVGGNDDSIPYFGSGHPGVFRLEINPVSSPLFPKQLQYEKSDFQWIGNHYRSIGKPALPETEKSWDSLRKWVKRNSTFISTYAPHFEGKKDIWCFPEAYRLLEANS